MRVTKEAPGELTRVLLADDHTLFREGVASLLERAGDIELVGEAATGEEAVRLAEELLPDIVLMDIRMPELDGIEATRRVLAEAGTEDVQVVMLTTFDLNEYVYEALRAGASGFLLKDVRPEQLVDGLRTVSRGDALLAPEITRRLIEEFTERPVQTEPPAALDQLTAREREIFELLARGLSNAQIAAKLIVSQATVKTHVRRVLQKLDLTDRIQAVVLAYESGFVRPGSG